MHALRHMKRVRCGMNKNNIAGIYAQSILQESLIYCQYTRACKGHYEPLFCKLSTNFSFHNKGIFKQLMCWPDLSNLKNSHCYQSSFVCESFMMTILQ